MVFLGVMLEWSIAVWAPLAVVLVALSGVAMTKGEKGCATERASSGPE